MVCQNLIDYKRAPGCQSCLNCVALQCQTCANSYKNDSCPKCRTNEIVKVSRGQIQTMEKVSLKCGVCLQLFSLLDF